MFERALKHLENNSYTWLITGVAGFIGSNLLESLLKLDQKIIGLDNFSTGFKHNLEDVEDLVTDKQWKKFKFIEGDIRSLKDCEEACSEVDYVLHQAALGSVPRSIDNPINTNENNITGFLNMLVAARDAKVKRFVYAASSSTYGDHPALPKVEENIGKPLSPYAVTKYVKELYADVFAKTYGFKAIGLRYFNVFGKRQNPDGAYAAVIPKWTSALIKNETVYINGDGETSRDFCYIENAIQANMLAALVDNEDSLNQVYNVAVGDRTTLNNLLRYLKKNLKEELNKSSLSDIVYRDFRPGDVKYSLADISKAGKLLGYDPEYKIENGLVEYIKWISKRI